MAEMIDFKVNNRHSQPYINRHKDFLLRHFSDRDYDYYLRVRLALNEYAKKQSGMNYIHVTSFIEILKRFQADSKIPQTKYHDYKMHRLTDHAFVRALERIYGVNIDTVKNRVIE